MLWIGIVCLLVTAPAGAEPEATPEMERMRLFGALHMTLTLEDGSAPGVIELWFYRDEEAEPAAPPLHAVRDSGRSYSTDVHCPFFGNGELEIVDSATLETLRILPIYCGVRHDVLSPHPVELQESLDSEPSESGTDLDPAAILEESGSETATQFAPAPTPVVLRASILESIFERSRTSNQLVEAFELSGKRTSSSETSRVLFEQFRKTKGSQYLSLHARETTTTAGGTTTVEWDQAIWDPASTVNFGYEDSQSTTIIERYHWPPQDGKVSTRETYRSATTTHSTTRLEFPEIPEGASVQAIRARAIGDVFFSRPNEWLYPGWEFFDPGQAVQDPWVGFGICPASAWRRNSIWRLSNPELAPDGTFVVSVDPVANCAHASETKVGQSQINRFSTVTAIHTGNILYEAEITETKLSLEPELPRIDPYPAITGRNPVPLRPKTKVLATLDNAPVGEHTIRVRIENFDALPGGHFHDGGTPPRTEDRLHDRELNMVGTISAEELEAAPSSSLDGDLEAECDVTVAEVDGETEAVSCEFEYGAGAAAGVVFLVAEVLDREDELEVEAETTIEIATEGFVDLRDAIPPTTPLGFVRNDGAPSAHHPDSEAFWARPQSAVLLQEYVEKYNEAIEKIRPGIHPEGIRLMLNDWSLPRGGIFDINGNWDAENGGHNSHRDGWGGDINVTPAYDVLTGDLVDPNRQMMKQVCSSLLPRFSFPVDEGPVHCQFR